MNFFALLAAKSDQPWITASWKSFYKRVTRLQNTQGVYYMAITMIMISMLILIGLTNEKAASSLKIQWRV